MSVIGPSDKVAALSRNLSPRLLAELVSDILTLWGHTKIKITDGPGDGCRDIHSIDREKQKTLSQCKFHDDTSKTVSSKEMGELPMGMVKLGYTKGVFVTNGEISPQAKREFLNDYKGLNLEYLDGRAIVSTVLGSAVLKALWFDGHEVGRVSNVLVVPVIARDLQLDKSFSIVDEGSAEQLRSSLQAKLPDVTVAVEADVMSSVNLFSPYRPPRIKNELEGILADLRAIEVVISGVLPLDTFDALIDQVAEGIIEFIDKSHVHKRKDYCIRMGKLSLTPLGGEAAGFRLPLKMPPFTALKINGETWAEHQWLLPSEHDTWKRPTQVRASSYNEMRFYNPALNVCVDYTILSPPSDQTRRQAEAKRQAFTWYWQRSLFALLPDNYESNSFNIQLPEANFNFDWLEGQVFKGWLHEHLSRGFYTMPVEDPEDVNNYVMSNLARDINQATEKIQELKGIVMSLGGKIVHPERARHIVAVFEEDPFSSEDVILYGTSQLIAELDDIPSPVDPKARKLVLTVCWRLGTKPSAINTTKGDELTEGISTYLSEEVLDIRGNVELDRETYIGDTCLVANIEEPAGYDPLEHIDLRLKRLVGLIEPLLQRLDKHVQENFPKAERATKEYWNVQFTMDF